MKISFFGDIHFGRIKNPLLTEDGTMQVASLDDLMAHKLKVILQRSEAKDYQDIVAMIQANISVEKGLASALAMYGLSFQPSESIKACTYFNDGDLHTLNNATKNILIQAVSKVKELPQIKISSPLLFMSQK